MYRMNRLATKHNVSNGRMDGQTEDIIIPIADHCAQYNRLKSDGLMIGDKTSWNVFKIVGLGIRNDRLDDEMLFFRVPEFFTA